MSGPANATQTCSLPDCTKRVQKRGWCEMHYMRWYRRGTTEPRPDVETRFWQRVRKTDDGCWEWGGTITKQGYGHFKVNGKLVSAHRFAYEFLHEPIPEGLGLDHLCRNRRCVNPAHLEPVTNAENLRRGRHAQREKTHCPKGHAYTPENTGPARVGRSWRRCRACHREDERLRRAA